jgi:hypothetical protein
MPYLLWDSNKNITQAWEGRSRPADSIAEVRRPEFGLRLVRPQPVEIQIHSQGTATASAQNPPRCYLCVTFSEMGLTTT